MKTPIRLIPAALAFVLLSLLSGCGSGSSGDETPYAGTWSGPTSHGGMVRFVVENGWVVSFTVDDAGASIWIQQPTELEGDTFEAHNSEDGSAIGAPGATVTGLFGDATHCTGSYTLDQDAQHWRGTYTATKQ